MATDSRSADVERPGCSGPVHSGFFASGVLHAAFAQASAKTAMMEKCRIERKTLPKTGETNSALRRTNERNDLDVRALRSSALCRSMGCLLNVLRRALVLRRRPGAPELAIDSGARE